MELFHGSYIAVEQPKIIKGRFTKDFGEALCSGCPVGFEPTTFRTTI